jgi:hypothetical protein
MNCQNHVSLVFGIREEKGELESFEFAIECVQVDHHLIEYGRVSGLDGQFDQLVEFVETGPGFLDWFQIRFDGADFPERFLSAFLVLPKLLVVHFFFETGELRAE